METAWILWTSASWAFGHHTLATQCRQDIMDLIYLLKADAIILFRVWRFWGVNCKPSWHDRKVWAVDSLFIILIGALFEDVGKMCMGSVARAQLHKIIAKNWGPRRLAPDLCGRVRTVDAARTLVNLVRHSCYAGYSVLAKRIGMAARSKASVMLRRSWYAGLQLEVAKRIVTAARKIVYDHSAALVLHGIAAGGC